MSPLKIFTLTTSKPQLPQKYASVFWSKGEREFIIALVRRGKPLGRHHDLAWHMLRPANRAPLPQMHQVAHQGNSCACQTHPSPSRSPIASQGDEIHPCIKANIRLSPTALQSKAKWCWVNNTTSLSTQPAMPRQMGPKSARRMADDHQSRHTVTNRILHCIEFGMCIIHVRFNYI